MKMKRKLILSLLAMLLPISAWCADGDTFSYVPDGSNVKFYFKVISEEGKTVELKNEISWGLAIEAVSSSLDSNIEIPSTVINGTTTYEVKQIGSFTLHDCLELTSVTIPNSVTKIGSQAFWGCVNLETINLPASLEEIEYQAFADCSKLTSIDLPAGLKTIGNSAFEGCAFTTLYIPALVTSIGNAPFVNNDKLISIKVSEANTVYNSTGNCNAIIYGNYTLIQGCKNTVIPNTTTIIDQRAFKGAGIEGTFTIPNSVTWIRQGAFQGNNIEHLEIGSGLSDLSSDAFCNVYNTVSVDPENSHFKVIDNCIIHKGVIYEWIDDDNYILKDYNTLWTTCKSATKVPDGAEIDAIASEAFMEHEMSSFTVPAGVKFIGGSAFEGCKNLESVIFEKDVLDIGGFAFNGCVNLESVNLNEGLTSIEDYAFFNCNRLSSLVIPTTVNSVQDNTFANSGKDAGSFTLYIPYTLNLNSSSGSFNYSEIPVSVIPYVKPAKTYTSFACPQDVDFSGATGLKAYVASGFDGTTKQVSLKEVTSAKAGEGIIIQATAGTKYDLALATASDNGTNLLVGVTADTAIEPTDGSNTNFLLSDGQFKKAQAGTLANGKAYLQLPTSAAARAKSLGITTEGDVTGIINIDLDEEGDGMIYDLNGHRISETATKGIYVKNGKKVIIK